MPPIGGLLTAAGPWAAFLALGLLWLWMMATDRLITRKAVERAIAAERRSAEAEVRRADDWRQAAGAASARADIAAQQLAEVLAGLRQSKEAA